MSGASLPGAVVVITGASSGIGRATAVAFARAGAHVVLAARRSDLLREVVAECLLAARKARHRKVRAVAVASDLGRDGDAVALADAATKRFGRIDVWVNNAGVGALGTFTDTPVASHDQIVRTNLLGSMHGAHAAVPQFQRQGRGVLINVISLGGWVPLPFAAAYTASKFGIRGFAEALRAELRPTRDIHVCNVYPWAIDTPGVQHAGNYTGRFLRSPPAYAPERVADTIVSLARTPRATVAVGPPTTLVRLGYALLPGLSGAISRGFIQRYLDGAPRVEKGPGNLFTPVPRGRTASGGWGAAGHHGLAAAGVAGFAGMAVAAGVATWLGLSKRS